jgi:flagellar biosynthetic protein FliP
MDLRVGNGQQGDGLRLNGTVGVVVMLGMMSLLPTLVLMTTGFTRILVVLYFLRQALGTQTSPPAPLIAGLALILTGFVMAPTMTRVNQEAITPWLDGKIEQVEMLERGAGPLREFMLKQTRPEDVRRMVRLSRQPVVRGEQVPFVTLMAAFTISELRTAFAIGFALFLPFIVIDVVVASVLMSLGMFMLPPTMIALPFKLLLFVLVDGWGLITQSLVAGFR